MRRAERALTCGCLHFGSLVASRWDHWESDASYATSTNVSFPAPLLLAYEETVCRPCIRRSQRLCTRHGCKPQPSRSDKSSDATSNDPNSTTPAIRDHGKRRAPTTCMKFTRPVSSRSRALQMYLVRLHKQILARRGLAIGSRAAVDFRKEGVRGIIWTFSRCQARVAG